MDPSLQLLSRRAIVLAVAVVLTTPAFAQDPPPATLEKVEIKE